MPIKYFAPKVTETMYRRFFLLEITVAKIMNNLNVWSAHSYLYPRSQFKLLTIKDKIIFLSSSDQDKTLALTT